MFGLSWAQIGIIVLVGAFVLGPERIPTAVTFVTGNLKKVRSMAAGAQSDLRREIGPELDELRRQVADLRSLTEMQGLRELQGLHPKRLLSKNLLGDELSGGITGFLGLKADPPKIFSLDTPSASAEPPAAVDGPTTPVTASAAQARNNAGADGGTPPALPPSMVKSMAGPVDGGQTNDRSQQLVAAGQLPPFDAEGT